MSDQIGYHGYDGTGLSEEILASKENLVEQSVTIDASCRDTQHDVTTDLRRGLVLWPDPTVADRYTQFDAAAKTALAGAEAVVLAVPLDISGSVDLVAKVYYGGVFKPDKLVDDSGYGLTHFDATERAKAQRIIIKNE
ncbi:MAG: hypothetical protein ACTSW7_01105 [Candidatus Thorarchaeota archaeon]|nr:MAG: hypothetical protein DRQ25_04920 [Candidatus Fermentibacteria bacterium]HEC72027.1 hypothetical protein [Thermoplasmatales archaeon]